MPADTVLVSCIFGSLLLAGGVALLSWHWRTWNSRRRDPTLSADDRRHDRRQWLRRSQVALLLCILGILIPAGDIWLTGRRDPRLFAWYVITLLILTLWLVLLAAVDWLASRVRNRKLRSSLAELERKRHALEAEASRLRSRRTNGLH